MKLSFYFMIISNLISVNVLTYNLNNTSLDYNLDFDNNLNEIDDKLSISNDFDINEFFTSLTDEDFENGRQLYSDNSLNDSFNKKYLFNKNLFEGDIILEDNQIIKNRNAIKGISNKWRNARIPYTISSDYKTEARAVIAHAILEFHNKTCIRFVPKRWLDISYIHIYPGLGCASLVGRISGKQDVSIDNVCLRSGVIQHELMHVVGFWHEQSRADRDDYIRINWENVEKGMEGNFIKFTWNEIQSLDEPYDYGSVMHYGTHAFARGFGSTLSPLRDVPAGVQIGQRNALSDIDINKINKLYNCERHLSFEKFINRLIKLITDLINV